MINIQHPGRGLVRRLGLAAAAILALSAVPGQRAEALSLINPGTVPSAKYASDGLIEVRGHGGHGGHGGGFHGGGFRGGGAAFHGGGFRAAPVFRGGGYRYSGYRYGGYRVAHHFHRHHFHRRFYAPAYSYSYPRYYYPHRYCRVVWTYYGPRKICPWRRHYRHHYYRYY